MLPTPVYEILPYAYLLIGGLAVVSLDIIIAKVCGALLITIGGFIYRERYRYRHQKTRLDDLKNIKAHGKTSKSEIARANQDLQKGEDCYEHGQYQEAAKWYRKAAEHGNASAQVNLGALYAEGQGVARDYQEALLWYHQAAQHGDAVACFNLGVMYTQGQGVGRDFQEALKWYRQAADQGHALAQFNLGLMYEQNGDTLSLQEAAAWYRQAAVQDYAPAQVNLGAMYIEGRGVGRDFAQALKWYQAAARQDYAPAQYNLGIMCFQGSQGLDKDLAMAYVWFSHAANQGDNDAQQMRDQVAGRLTAEQKNQVRQLLDAAAAE